MSKKTLFIVDEWEGEIVPGEIVVNMEKFASRVIYIGAATDCSEAFLKAEERDDERTQR